MEDMYPPSGNSISSSVLAVSASEFVVAGDDCEPPKEKLNAGRAGWGAGEVPNERVPTK